MNATQTLSPTWIADCEWMQCPDCGGELEPANDSAREGLNCLTCQRVFPFRDGILDMLKPLEGNNKVAADFYNGPLWPRFRFWEWFTFMCNGGERRARRQIMKYMPNLSGTRLLEVAIGDGANVSFVPPDCQIVG
ncbi:MAG TPA: Trm112 family protein, partial [Gemmataceae bacterium]